MLYALCPASTTPVNPWSGPKDRSLKPTKMKAKDSFTRLPTEQESTLSRVVSVLLINAVMSRVLTRWFAHGVSKSRAILDLVTLRTMLEIILSSAARSFSKLSALPLVVHVLRENRPQARIRRDVNAPSAISFHLFEHPRNVSDVAQVILGSVYPRCERTECDLVSSLRTPGQRF